MKENKKLDSPSIFTRYVSTIAEGEAPTAELLEELWQGLRAALISEMRKRSAWSTPPSYLGVLGRESWTAGEGEAPDDPLDELLGECFGFIFLRRIEGLTRQLSLKPNIDGLVFRNIRNFLHDTQRKHDPLGYRVFATLRTAIEQLVDNQQLQHPTGGRLRSTSILSFESDGSPTPVELLGGTVAGWAEELLPEIFQSTAAARRKVTERLARRLAELPEHGVVAFRLGELLQPLKSNIRVAWAAQLALDQGASALEDDEDRLRPVLTVELESEIEDRDLFSKLVDCIERKLRNSTASAKTQRYLGALWAFLRAFAAGSGNLDGLRQDGRMPSGRRLAQNLGIPRDRLRDLFDTLGDELQTCRAAISAVRPVSRLGGSRSVLIERDRTMNCSVRSEALRQQAARAAELRRTNTSAPRADNEVCPGDILLEPTTAELAVEWVVIDRRERPSTVLVVPADDNPLVGSRDLEVSGTRGAEALVLRCGFGLWLAPDQLRQASTFGRLQKRHTAAALKLWQELETGSREAAVALQETDRDPLYRDRSLYELAEARRRLAALPHHVGQPGRTTSPPFRHRGKLQLAAAVLLVLGCGWFELQRRELRWLEQRWLDDDVPTISLDREVFRGPQAPSEPVVLPPDEPGYKLEISLPPLPEGKDYNSYQIVLKLPGQTPLARPADEISRAGRDKLIARFKRSDLQPGTYQVEVWGTSDQEARVVLHYQQALFEFAEHDDD